MYTYKISQDSDGRIYCIIRSDGWSIPPDPANAHYQQYLEWIAEGNMPLPAD